MGPFSGIPKRKPRKIGGTSLSLAPWLGLDPETFSEDGDDPDDDDDYEDADGFCRNGDAAGPDGGDDVVHAAMMTACRRNDKQRQVAECQTAHIQEDPCNLYG